MKKDKNKEEASAKYLVGLLLKADVSQMQVGQVKELLSILIWKITESNGKYKLRFVSENALIEKSKKNLIHEHVYERAKLVNELLANPSMANDILVNAVACLVTVEDHKALSDVDKSLHGWDRYKAAGIKVFDNETQKFINLKDLSKKPLNYLSTW